MSNFKDLKLSFKYRSDFDSIHRDFMQPCIERSLRYDRAVGYFNSNSLRLMAQGLEVFIKNRGKTRIITNPFLDETDFNAIELGIKSKTDIIIKSMLDQLDKTSQNIQSETLNILAWLISEDLLEIKIAFTKDRSIYHEKFGLFYDIDGERILFSGSSNETLGGLNSNFEKIDVFTEPKDIDRIVDAEKDFEMLWINNTPGLEVIDVPDVIKNKILKYKKEQPQVVIDKELANKPSTRPYQDDAIAEFQKNGYKGIFEMATGTGKTITSLFAAEKFKGEKKKAVIVIIVPFIHLVDQWESEINRFGKVSIVKCYGESKKWVYQLEDLVDKYNHNRIECFYAVTTYKSSMGNKFVELLKLINSNLFLIADECHYFGSQRMRTTDFDFIQYRLGLSATPQRWWDEVGSSHITRYFDKVVYEFPLEKAIKLNFLTEYKYTPVLVSLDSNEVEDYNELTLRIVKLINSKKEEDREKAKKLAISRRRILTNANQKKEKFRELLGKLDKNESHILVYCGPTELNEVTLIISSFGFVVSKFDQDVQLSNRITILEEFGKGNIQVLVAIKCLDEGVDVPSTKTAYFLASTTNPKEFIQRRGRVLRIFEGKKYANIIDFVVIPDDYGQPLFEDITRKELPRFAEFADYAVNKYEARKSLWPILEPYNLQFLLDKKSWEVYYENKIERMIDQL